MQTLEELFELSMKDAYSEERQILKALPKMIKKASNKKLQQGFEKHLKETEKQVERLETIGEKLGIKLGGHNCKGMEGIIAENEEFLKEEKPESEVCDAGMIAGAQKVEHYEISLYGTLIAYAKELGYDKEVVDLLIETLNEEKTTDEKLSELAMGGINQDAE